MNTHDDRFDDAALRAHDDEALEVVRFELARDGDHRLPQVVHVLMTRAAPTIVLTCRELGARRSVARRDVLRAISDAIARTQLRLHRVERFSPIERLAASIARDCIAAQPTDPAAAPKLAPRPPDLRLIQGLLDGSVHPNDPEMS